MIRHRAFNSHGGKRVWWGERLVYSSPEARRVASAVGSMSRVLCLCERNDVRVGVADIDENAESKVSESTVVGVFFPATNLSSRSLRDLWRMA